MTDPKGLDDDSAFPFLQSEQPDDSTTVLGSFWVALSPDLETQRAAWAVTVFKVSARTVLALGSELISSDIIAFYELAKNAFDAGSKTGVEIRFGIALSRRSYERVRTRAERVLDGKTSETVDVLIEDVKARLESSASDPVKTEFMTSLSKSKSMNTFVERLDEAFRTLNTITISDSGSGMSSTDLEKNYLVIGTPSRKRDVDRALKQHERSPFLGEKGIGRLSAIRLGERLRIETARATDVHINVLDIDWRRFSDLDAMIEDVEIAPEVGGAKPSKSWSGTTLRISDLSADWSHERVTELAEYNFARILDPFEDPKKRPRIAIFWNDTRVNIPFMDRALLDHAHAAFRGSYSFVKDEPVLRCFLEAIDLGFKHPRETDKVTLSLPDLDSAIVGTSEEIPLAALSSVGPFEFEAYWYNRRRLAAIDSIGDQRVVRDLQKRWSGILVFRDGFRVFPYGEDEDDWLGLDRKALGRPSYLLNKTQFVGHVNISRSSNPGLVDQTNREGLRVGDDQRAFVAILQHVIQVLLFDFLRETERRYKKQRVNLAEDRDEISKLEARAKTAISKMRKAVPRDNSTLVDEVQQAFLEFQELTARAYQRIEEVEEDSREMVHMAGIGLMVEVVAHELARSSENALATLAGLKGKAVPEDVRSRLETLRSEMNSVSKRLRVLDPLSVSGRQRSEVFDVSELLNELRDAHAPQFARSNITMKLDLPKKPVRIKAVKGMVIQILENLLSNSVHWTELRAQREKQFKPTISVRVETDPVTIFFKDNGPGIAPENRERIFRAFWSLKEKTKRRGLGLYIARENANYLGATLDVGEPDRATERLQEFVLEFPAGASV